MERAINQETINDTAKLLLHRLIAREIARDPSLIERAKIQNMRSAARYEGCSFVEEWDELLRLSPGGLRRQLTSRESKMVRLRISSPFPLATGIDVTDYSFRLRLRRAAKRIVLSRLGGMPANPASR